ncbi:MAG: hypothetical protein NTW52_12270 [Planctomycetota bacterium]|nr:hypothetical protein [Planctomycetota bacterium]
MRFDVTKWTRLAVLGMVSGACLFTGCSSSSGWKMPGSKMFSWSKKPSETTLAGAGPSSIKYPDSPASKQTPQAIASAAAGTAPGKSGFGSPVGGATSLAATGTGARTAQPTYTPPNGMANVAFAPPAAAAAANGYSVGPYNTYSQPGGAANNLATTGAPSAFGGATPAAGMSPGNPFNATARAGFPSTQVYAGSTPGTVAANHGTQMPASFQPPSAPQGAPSSGFPGMAAPGTANSFAAASSNPNLGSAAAPVQKGTSGFAVPQSMPSTGGYAPVGTPGMAQPTQGSFAAASSNALPGTMPPSGLPAIPTAQAPTGMTSVPAQMAAYTGSGSGAPMSTATFRPGSTGRQTNYNFSQPSTPSSSSAVANPMLASPTSVPAANTANSLNNPGYNPGFQIPPTNIVR